MRVLAAQLASLERDVAGNLAIAVDVITRAAGTVELVVFPELFLGGYDTRAVAELAIDVEGYEIQRIANAARCARTAVMIGFHRRVERGVSNALACIDEQGRVVACYEKTQLFGRERQVFVAGEAQLVVRLVGRSVAPLICFDVEFPEPARAAAHAGADLLVTASANMAPCFDEHRLATRARALDNRLPHIYVNSVGVIDGTRFVGGSRCIADDGHIVAELTSGYAATAEFAVPTRTPITGAVDYVRLAPVGPCEVRRLPAEPEKVWRELDSACGGIRDT